MLIFLESSRYKIFKNYKTKQFLKYVVLVRVVCEDRNADYSIAFQNFAEADLKYEVKWESKPPNDKYILLFNIESRIPEDVRRAVEKLNIKGEIKLRRSGPSERMLNDNTNDY